MLTKTKQYLILIAKGFCMGAADIVPGVSGGTMAFILGIYQELIDAIVTLRWKFLLLLGTGVLSAVLVLSIPLEYALLSQPALVWSFFFGLVVASVVVVFKRVTAWTPTLVVATIFGALCAYIFVGLVPVDTPETPWFLILCGAVAISAMILPGISGSFLLVLLGKYEFILSAINTRDVLPIIYIGIGAVIGIVVFARVLKWVFARFHDITVAVLIGLMIGSLRKIWPFAYADQGQELHIVLLILLGAFTVFALEYFAQKQ